MTLTCLACAKMLSLQWCRLAGTTPAATRWCAAPKESTGQAMLLQTPQGPTSACAAPGAPPPLLRRALNSSTVMVSATWLLQLVVFAHAIDALIHLKSCQHPPYSQDSINVHTWCDARQTYIVISKQPCQVLAHCHCAVLQPAVLVAGFYWINPLVRPGFPAGSAAQAQYTQLCEQNSYW